MLVAWHVEPLAGTNPCLPLSPLQGFLQLKPKSVVGRALGAAAAQNEYSSPRPEPKAGGKKAGGSSSGTTISADCSLTFRPTPMQ